MVYGSSEQSATFLNICKYEQPIENIETFFLNRRIEESKSRFDVTNRLRFFN